MIIDLQANEHSSIFLGSFSRRFLAYATNLSSLLFFYSAHSVLASSTQGVGKDLPRCSHTLPIL